MINYSDIKKCEIELSSYCNAECPLCPRNLFGYPYNSDYTVRNLTLADVRTIFDREFCDRVDFTFEGNFGDPIMNPELLEIVDYLNSPIKICTNGSMQTQLFWQQLAEQNTHVLFGIDGLSGTHEIYRRGTKYETVINNARTFIDAGGTATWKMIEFDHNRSEIEACRELSKQLGFKTFQLVDHGRNSGPVFDRTGKLERVLGNFTGSTDLSHYIDTIENGDIFLEDIQDIPRTVSCMALKQSSIYVSSTGDVYPCCFMGFSPRTYGQGRWHQPVNKQITELLDNSNNALKTPLNECIEWFNRIPSCWNKSNFEDGRLVVCDNACGN
jgi:MoaA/NifB/PqqE/SkfB family radical SAM enzyme